LAVLLAPRITGVHVHVPHKKFFVAQQLGYVTGSHSHNPRMAWPVALMLVDTFA